MSASTLLHPSSLVLAAALVAGCVIPKSVGSADDAQSDSSGTSNDTAQSEAPPGPASSDGPGATGATGPASDGEPSTGTTAPVEPTDDDSGGSFLVRTDGGGILDPCDPWSQNCGPGEKCTPSALIGSDSTTWNFNRCSPIVDDPAGLGEPCTVEGSPLSGIDTCELGAMCWDVDPDTLEGVCIGLCMGSEDTPSCAQEGTMCIIANDGWLPICLPTCDPVQPDCEPGQACHPFGDVFVCAPEGEDPGGVGESCEDIAMCDHGLVCVSPELVPDCPSAGCCTAWCDVTDPMPPCLPEQVCTAWYEPDMAPEGYENLGACMLPG